MVPFYHVPDVAKPYFPSLPPHLLTITGTHVPVSFVPEQLCPPYLSTYYYTLHVSAYYYVPYTCPRTTCDRLSAASRSCDDAGSAAALRLYGGADKEGAARAALGVEVPGGGSW